ncbi:MAG: hypothetical protein H3Z53_11885 [archaeon]|nr:hypothetical protein [archaeon]MCP8315047.1 hypothetical protein [archaeon]
MPKQIFSAEDFKSLSENAVECRVLRMDDKVKLKLRTPKMLYVFITSKEEADNLLKDIKVEVKEIK